MKYYNNYPHDKKIAELYNPLVEEKKTLQFWCKKKTIDKIKESRLKENSGHFSFHNGPPFPSGSPHSGQIFNAIVKDIFTRYAYQKGLQVAGEFGWDCHGLPIEHEVDKRLEIKRPQNFHAIGVEAYNDECRKFVQKQEAEWKNVFESIGIWVDFSSTYSTMSQDYMEALWNTFKKLYEKKLVYKDTKVLSYSTSCFTHLSDFEADQNWKRVDNVFIIVSLQVVDADVRFLVWTDAPWNLIGNLAACVNPRSKYVKIKSARNGQIYIVSQNRLPFVFSNSSEYTIIENIMGKHLENLKYHPLFDYLPGNFTVLLDESIRDDFGTGIVALCPHFSQADYRICKKNNLSTDKELCPIDSSGHFKLNITQLAGLSIGEANLLIMQSLQDRNHLVHVENLQRPMKHCWRSEVPLINKLVSTWFLKVDNLKARMKTNNCQTKWIPEYLKEIMNEKVEQLNDWPIGRQRYFGTPIPIWVSPSGDEMRCIGSVKELLELSGAKSVTDLHKEFIDKLLIPSSVPGNPPLRRVPEVFDCWFESGLMPFIQERSTADLIVEGSDQTNGWFLTTTVLSAALSLPPPSIAAVAHGLVLSSSEGKKLAKRKYNHNDSIRIAEKYGADALRLYLVTSPLMTGEDFILKESDVKKMLDNVIQPFFKIVHDLLPCFGKKGWVSYGVINSLQYLRDQLDIWMLSKAEALLQFYDAELTARRLHLVIPRLIEFLKDVQDWYVPIMRSRDPKIQGSITFTMFNVVFKACIVLAPFAPFLAEHVYQELEPYVGGYFRKDFVHDVLIPEQSQALMQTDVMPKIERWRRIIEIVREIRLTHLIPIGYRINELIVVHPIIECVEDPELLKDTLRLVNVHQLKQTTDYKQFGAKLVAKLKDNSSLHEVLTSADIQNISLAVEQFTENQVVELVRVGSEQIHEQFISIGDVDVSYILGEENDKKSLVSSENVILIVIRMNKDIGYYEEGTRLELITSIQKLRKKAKVFPSDVVSVCYLTKDDCAEKAFQKYSKELRKATNSNIKRIDDVSENEEEVYQEAVDIKGMPVILYVFREKQTDYK